MNASHTDDQHRTEQIRQAVRDLARLIGLRYSGESSRHLTQSEHIIHKLTDLLHDEHAALGMEQAIRDLYQIEYLRQRVLSGEISLEREQHDHLPR